MNPAAKARVSGDAHRPEQPKAGYDPPGNDGTTAGVGPDLFKAVLRHHAAGVAVITAGADRPIGFCATSLASVSLEPPLVSFAVGLRSASWTTLATARHVAVHLLTDLQEETATRFTRPGTEKFAPGVRWHRGPYALPVLDDVLAWMVLEPTTRLHAGDHALVIGRVIEAGHAPHGGPLIHHNGGFLQLSP